MKIRKKTYERPDTRVVKCAPVEIICSSAVKNGYESGGEEEEVWG